MASAPCLVIHASPRELAGRSKLPRSIHVQYCRLDSIGKDKFRFDQFVRMDYFIHDPTSIGVDPTIALISESNPFVDSIDSFNLING